MGYELPPEYHQIRFSEKGGFSPEINSECQEMMCTIVEDFYREKKRKEDEKKKALADQPDPEYLAFRAELQPIFDCLNGYKFKKDER